MRIKAKRTKIDGITFDSKGEAKRWLQLRNEEKLGLISNLRRQVTYVLATSVYINGRKKPPLRYIADFVYTRLGIEIIEDYKGGSPLREVYKVKRHLMKAVHGIDIFES